MSIKIIPPKLAKKDLLALYDITHPTLRIWFRRAGLGDFVGRRRFFIEEVVLIFQVLGRPRLARTAAQRLKDVYARVTGQLPAEERFREKYKQELPAQKQDCLPDSEEELDEELVYEARKESDRDPKHLGEALTRLIMTAVCLRGRKGSRLVAKQRSLDIVERTVGRRCGLESLCSRA